MTSRELECGYCHLTCNSNRVSKSIINDIHGTKCRILWCRISQQGTVGEIPEEGHKIDKSTEAFSLQRQAEKGGAVHPEEERRLSGDLVATFQSLQEAY